MEQVVILGVVGSVVSGRARDCRQPVTAQYHTIMVSA